MHDGSKSRKRRSRNIVGRRVKEARTLHFPPLTQDQLSGKLAAEGVQLDRVGIAKIETGIRCAFDFEVRALAAALKVDANWLLGIGSASGEGALGSRGGAERKDVSFDTSAYLRRATGRAKSDVANKLVSMFLHEVSRRLCGSTGIESKRPAIRGGCCRGLWDNCCYCGSRSRVTEQRSNTLEE